MYYMYVCAGNVLQFLLVINVHTRRAIASFIITSDTEFTVKIVSIKLFLHAWQ